jgi:hypothetical protein
LYKTAIEREESKEKYRLFFIKKHPDLDHGLVLGRVKNGNRVVKRLPASAQLVILLTIDCARMNTVNLIQ